MRIGRCCPALLSLVATLAVATPARPDAGAGTTGWAARLEAARTAKDSLFRHAPDSPIPSAVRATFAGLGYFPPDSACRISGELHAYGRRTRVQMPTSGGGTVAMKRYGRFVAALSGQAFSLEAYRSLEDGALEVFFTDATSGEESYEGGRYVRIHRGEADGGWLLDFNECYNPYCAYNPSYACPLPPPGNHLPFAVRAGERRPGADLAH